MDRRVPAYGHALVAEIRKLSVRVSTGPRHGAAGVDDESTDAAPGARRPTTMLTRLRQVLTVEAVVAAQAVDPAVPTVLGRGPEFLRRSIRKFFPAWTTTDRAGWTWRRYAATSPSPTTSGAHCAP